MSTHVSSSEQINLSNEEHLKAIDSVKQGPTFSDINSSGIQNYKISDEGIGEEDAFRYNDITGTPLENLTTRGYENELTVSQIKAGIYRRIILVRYNGEITEVYPEEYDKFKDYLAKGLYTELEVYWATKPQNQQTPEEWNTDQVRSALRLIDAPLRTATIQFFREQANFEGTPSRRLVIDIFNYKSPLSEK